MCTSTTYLLFLPCHGTTVVEIPNVLLTFDRPHQLVFCRWCNARRILLSMKKTNYSQTMTSPQSHVAVQKQQIDLNECSFSGIADKMSTLSGIHLSQLSKEGIQNKLFLTLKKRLECNAAKKARVCNLSETKFYKIWHQKSSSWDFYPVFFSLSTL